jgi:2-amino-4-hydroxy-6-hydroxymethyldihydropteridine diphosphokinase
MREVFLGIGSNLGDREGNISSAAVRIGKLAGEILAYSSVYETEPWGFNSGEDFLNMVLKLKTALEPTELLRCILSVESEMGRVRNAHQYSSRLIDIDILLYEDLIFENDYLAIPHPRLHERKFVLIPLCEIEADFVHPVLKKSLADLLAVCKDENKVLKKGSLL